MLAPYLEVVIFYRRLLMGDNITMHNNEYSGRPADRRLTAGRGTAAAVALLLTGSVIGWSASNEVGPTAAAAPAPAAASAPAPLPGAGVSYAGVVDQITPAV